MIRACRAQIEQVTIALMEPGWIVSVRFGTGEYVLAVEGGRAPRWFPTAGAALRMAWACGTSEIVVRRLRRDSSAARAGG